MAKKACPRVIGEYLVHDPVIINDELKGRSEDNGLGKIVDGMQTNKTYEDFRGIGTADYDGKGGYGCGMI